MNSSQSPLERHLKQHGLRLTRPRLAVFAALQGQPPQTMQQLVAACPAADRASVYRTVALFERLGIAQRLQMGWKYKLELSDSFSHHHHHLTCSQCGRVSDFSESSELVAQLHRAARLQGFTMRDHQLEIQGLCQACSGPALS